MGAALSSSVRTLLNASSRIGTLAPAWVTPHHQVRRPTMIKLPDPKPEVMARRDAVIAGLRAAVSDAEGVIADPISLKPYETDGLSAYRQMPLAVALPETTEEVAAIMRFCHANGVRVVPRGAGTSLSGGAL